MRLRLRTCEPIDVQPLTLIPAEDSDLSGARRAPAPADLPIFVIPTKAGIQNLPEPESVIVGTVRAARTSAFAGASWKKAVI